MSWFWIGFWVIWFGPVVYMALTARSDVKVTELPSISNKKTLIVHLAGLNGDGELQIHNAIDSLRRLGDMVAVHYNGRLFHKATWFSLRKTVNVTVETIEDLVANNDYKNVVLIGTSMGGKIAERVAQRLGPNIKTKFVGVDPPRGWRDLQLLQQIVSPVMMVLPFTPLGLLFVVPGLRWLFVRFVLVIAPQGDHLKRLTHEQKQMLDKSIEVARQVRPLYYWGHVWMTLRPYFSKLPVPWSVDDVVIVRSVLDTDVVRESAYLSWAKHLGFYPQRFTVQAKHAAYGEYPQEYLEAWPKIFRVLGV